MLLRELVGGDPPHACKLILIDDPKDDRRAVLALGLERGRLPSSTAARSVSPSNS